LNSYVEETGSGFPLLLIQGLGQSSWPGRRLAPSFADRRRVILFDNRGTGRSPKEPPPESIEQLASDAAAVLDGRIDGQADVMGHSMGGYIAQTLALQRPDLVRSLVLVGTGAGEPTHEHVPEATNSAWLAHAHLPPEEYARGTMHLSFAEGWKEAHEEEYERMVRERIEHPTPPECWRAQYDACLRFIQQGLPIETISVPTLVVHGDVDRVVPVSNGRAIAARIPGAELEIFPGSGHYPYFEDPERFARVVGDFLDRADEE
jgi:pimeloyl-ACP methyl ester carboxylesterase